MLFPFQKYPGAEISNDQKLSGGKIAEKRRSNGDLGDKIYMLIN